MDKRNWQKKFQKQIKNRTCYLYICLHCNDKLQFITSLQIEKRSHKSGEGILTTDNPLSVNILNKKFIQGKCKQPIRKWSSYSPKRILEWLVNM